MKFECQESCGGNCCKIPKDAQFFVFLTSKDRMKLASVLKKPINKFAQRSHFSSTRFGGKGWNWHFKIKSGDACPFLTKTGKCSVYEARPTQCRTWPFWPEITTEKTETQENLKTICPGIGVGPEISEDQVNAKREEQRKADAVYTNHVR